MANNLKYIGSKVDDKPGVLCLGTCNMCPYLHIEPHSKTTFCKNPKEPDLVKKFINSLYSYTYIDGYYFPLVDIPIPEWCQLDDIVSDVIMRKKITYKKSGDIHVESIESFGAMDFFSYKNVKYNGSKLVLNIKYIRDRENEYKPQYAAPIPIKPCSFCGEDKSEVDRTKNLGMCNDCWDRLSKKNDNDKVYFAYMNNFRLKRKAPYSDLKFKKISNNIKIK